MQYHLLYDIAKILHEQQLNPHRTFQTLLSRTGQALEVSYGCLMTFTEKREVDNIYILGLDDSPQAHDRSIWMSLFSHGLIGYAYHSNRQMVIHNIATDPRWASAKAPETLPQTGSAIGIPLSNGRTVSAVMLFIHPKINYFTDEHHAFLTELQDLATGVLVNLKQSADDASKAYDTRYQAIFEHTPVPVVLTDSKGLITDANYKACEFLGFKRSVLQGIPLQDVNIVSPDEIKTITDEEKYLPTNTYDIDGNSIPTLIRARRIELDGDTYIEWILQDMSVQMELEQLRHDLSAMVYHDLRGPLASIHMAINKLAELLQGHENPAVIKILRLGLRSTQQVSRLVETLLDIQRLEGGSTILNKQASEIHRIMTDAVQLVLPLAESADITIDMDIARLPIIYVDTDMITRVIINLMENAVKYTPNGSKMTLRAEQVDDAIHVTVSDSGPGIPAEMRDTIFDKFSRVKYQDAPKGVGLGLAFCRLAVVAHGGRIWVESDGEFGSDFIFALPIEDLPETAELTPYDESDSQEFATIA